ncbi:MAG: hypothetical protein RSE21_01130 [Bacilli bacterium]
MINKKEILKTLNQFNINKYDPLILSGASLVLQGIKEETNDIDIAVSKENYKLLLKDFNCVPEEGVKDVYYIDDVINFGKNYYKENYLLYDNYKIQTVEEIIKLKKTLNRKKDLLDIELINNYKKNKINLHFTGCGAMFEPHYGNTSATFKDGSNLFIIDCGTDVANSLILNKIINENLNFYLLITHTHCDHIGSIGVLAQYIYYKLGKTLNIVTSNKMKYIKNIKNILDGMLVEKECYKFINEEELDNKNISFNKIRYVETYHGEKYIKSTSIIIYSDNGNILYTGDINNSDIIKKFIKENNNIDKIYTDSCYNESKVHVSINELSKEIPKNIKNKVYCMHFDDIKLIDAIKKNGFNYVVKGVNKCKK